MNNRLGYKRRPGDSVGRSGLEEQLFSVCISDLQYVGFHGVDSVVAKDQVIGLSRYTKLLRFTNQNYRVRTLEVGDTVYNLCRFTTLTQVTCRARVRQPNLNLSGCVEDNVLVGITKSYLWLNRQGCSSFHQWTRL